jgi:phosphonate transport system ATP-binding protein
MLEMHQLSKHYGKVRAVDNVSMHIPEGQMVGIIGRSGAGKSTLLCLINRLVEPTRGKIRYQGKDITGLRGGDLLSWRSDCAMIFQGFNLVNRLSVISNVLAGRLNNNLGVLSLLKVFPAKDRAMAIKALDKLGMTDHAYSRADQLSGGQQQRVAIARALVQSPRLMLADEPIASLDPHNARLVMEALRAINREHNLTVLANLHTLDTARIYCDRILGMAGGKMVFDGTADDLTHEKLTEIYAGDLDEEGRPLIDESITSTSLDIPDHSSEDIAKAS